VETLGSSTPKTPANPTHPTPNPPSRVSGRGRCRPQDSREGPKGYWVLLGLADQLTEALITYSESGGHGNPTFDTAQAIAVMLEKHGIAYDLMHGFNWDKCTGKMSNDEIVMSN
jgi:hypothetical protein